MARLIIVFLLCVFSFSAFSQQTPAADQSGPIAIVNATLHLGNGEKIENGAIGFSNGLINFVGASSDLKEGDYPTIVDGEGKDVYPGFIAPNTQIGLKEIDAVRATRDNREVGGFNPNIRSIIAYNTDSKVTPTIRSNGTLLAEIVPEGGRIPGTSSLVELDGWNWEDAAFKEDVGIHLRWPVPFSYGGWWSNPGPMKKNNNYEKQVSEIEKHFNEAKAYASVSKPSPKNLKLEAMEGLFDGSKKLFVHTDYAKTIEAAVLFAKEMGVECVIIGGADSWMITDFLKKHETPVVLSNVQSLPSREDEDVDQPFKTASMLAAAGVDFCFSMGGAWEQRNLVFQAGQAIAFGLDQEEGVKGLTGNTAKIYGIADRVGTLETGKEATLIMSAGDVFDMRTSKIELAFINGKQIDLDNKQKALYRKFKGKYEQK